MCRQGVSLANLEISFLFRNDTLHEINKKNYIWTFQSLTVCGPLMEFGPELWSLQALFLFSFSLPGLRLLKECLSDMTHRAQVNGEICDWGVTVLLSRRYQKSIIVFLLHQ